MPGSIDYNLLIVVVASAMGLLLAFWVYFVDRKNRINQTFALFTLSIVSYIIFGYLSYYPKDPHLLDLWQRLFLTFSALFLLFAYFFSVYFPRKGKESPFLNKVVVVTQTSFIFLFLFTDFIIRGAEIKEGSIEMVWGAGKIAWFVNMIIISLVVLGQVVKKYFKLPEKEKLQAQYFIVGIFFFALINYAFNVFISYFFNVGKYYYFTGISAILLFGFTAYAVVKKGLFDIKLALTFLLVGAIGTLLFTQIAVAPTTTWRILGIIALVFFSFFSYLLIRATSREVKQKEILEQKVQERTGELQESKKFAEEKAEKLEKFYRLTVGREMKMAELKKKNEELEKKLEEHGKE